MPAAAVIPAPVAYAKVVAVKKLVAETWVRIAGSAGMVCTSMFSPSFRYAPVATRVSSGSFTVKKLECSKQALYALNSSAWDDRTGLCVYFVGF